MSPGKILIAGVVATLIASGCVKKPKQAEDSEFSRMPQTTDDSTRKSTNDIFDEFYTDDSSAATQKKRETASGSFSPATPMARPSVGSSSYTPGFTEGGRYVVQISTVRSRTLADELAAQMNAKGYPAYVAEVQNPTPALTGAYYRIRIGGFPQVTAARAFGENLLRPNGYDYWVDNRSNDNVGIDGYGFGQSGGSSGYSSPEPATTSTTSWDSPAASAPATPAPAATPVPAAVESAPAAVTPAPASSPVSTPAATPAAAPKTGAAGSGWGTDEWGDTTGW